MYIHYFIFLNCDIKFTQIAYKNLILIMYIKWFKLLIIVEYLLIILYIFKIF